MEIRPNLDLIPAVFGLLLAFGVLYNHLVGWLERRGYAEGYTAFLVVVGVLVTVAGLAVIDWLAAVLVLVCFAASGAPMIVGSWQRYVSGRRAAQDAIRREIDDQAA